MHSFLKYLYEPPQWFMCHLSNDYFICEGLLENYVTLGTVRIKKKLVGFLEFLSIYFDKVYIQYIQ
jgi:hypothetical protein